MLARTTAALICLLTLGAASAEAHFVWIDLAPAAGGQPQARLYFGEQPEPGEPHLVGKIAHTKAWSRTAQGESVELKVGTPESESGVLPLVGTATAPASLEAICDYGVYQRGPAGLLLQYYAKRLSGDWAQSGKLARAERLPLDIVPAVADGKLNLEVLYQGKASAASEVIVINPAGKESELKTDAEGKVAVKVSESGRYAVRAAHLETDKSGTRGDKKYAQTWHYCTLLVDVAGDPASADSASATDMLKRARDARAIWNDFPGYTADLTVTNGAESITGQAKIDANGIVELKLPESKLADWVEEQLNSLVQHRMPDGEVNEGTVTFAEEAAAHPLGRKLDLGDPTLQSAYRIKDDVIMEVNRTAGPAMRFTISVLEVEWNAEHKYLPRAFTMNFFNSKSGALAVSNGYLNEWSRVGSFDLPKTIVEVSAHPGGTSTRKIAFTNCQLLSGK